MEGGGGGRNGEGLVLEKSATSRYKIPSRMAKLHLTRFSVHLVTGDRVSTGSSRGAPVVTHTLHQLDNGSAWPPCFIHSSTSLIN